LAHLQGAGLSRARAGLAHEGVGGCGHGVAHYWRSRSRVVFNVVARDVVRPITNHEGGVEVGALGASPRTADAIGAADEQSTLAGVGEQTVRVGTLVVGRQRPERVQLHLVERVVLQRV